MQIEKIPAVGFASNCWLLWDEKTKEAAVIDPSALLEETADVLRRHDVRLTKILLTHGHFDHIFSLDALRTEYGVPALIHESDAGAVSDPLSNASAFFLHENHIYRPAEILLSGEDEFSVGELTLRVLHTPGHTPGSVCYAVGGALFTGDTLFDCGIGRTDLPGGDDVQMRVSLLRLTQLAGETKIYPGHGGVSDIHEQVLYNPYL